MAKKDLFMVTLPCVLVVPSEGADAKEATAAAVKNAESIIGKSFGILHVVGDAKATAVTLGKAKTAPAKDDDEEEEESEDDEEEEESEDEEEEEEEEEKPAKKKAKKADEKPEKKKIKIKLKG